MNTAMEVLVIIVSATLTLFLLLAIVVLVFLLKVLHSIRRITQKAEAIADKAEMVGEFFGKAAGPVAIGRLITNIADNVFKHNKHHKKESPDED